MMGFPVRRSWPSHHPTRPVPACRAASTRQPPSKASAECYQNISRRNRATDRSPLEAPAVPGGGPDSAQSRAVRSNGHLALVGEIGHGTLRLGQGRERGGDVFRISSRGRPQRGPAAGEDLCHREDCKVFALNRQIWVCSNRVSYAARSILIELHESLDKDSGSWTRPSTAAPRSSRSRRSPRIRGSEASSGSSYSSQERRRLWMTSSWQ